MPSNFGAVDKASICTSLAININNSLAEVDALNLFCDFHIRGAGIRQLSAFVSYVDLVGGNGCHWSFNLLYFLSSLWLSSLYFYISSFLFAYICIYVLLYTLLRETPHADHRL